MQTIGIIGGSGLEQSDMLTIDKETHPATPYGKPSSSLKHGHLNGVPCILLSRHGYDHELPPTQVNNRANIYALQQAGCSHIIATTACGSLREAIGRGHMVFPDQFIDFTRFRQVTFYEHFAAGKMKHTPMADPFSPELREVLEQSAKALGIHYHNQATLLTIEGPRFSTRAESHMFRAWGADLINMSTAPEVILANELGIPYAAIAMSTDYDSWKSDEEPVSWEEVLLVFQQNVHHVVAIIGKAMELIYKQPLKS